MENPGPGPLRTELNFRNGGSRGLAGIQDSMLALILVSTVAPLPEAFSRTPPGVFLSA